MYMKGIKELFQDKTIHIEKAKGNYETNFEYCSKDKDYFVWGKPKTGGIDI